MRTVHRYGDLALLVDCADTDEVLALAAEIGRHDRTDVVDIVPGARSVLVRTCDPTGLDTLAEWASALPPGPAQASTADEVTIPVRYDGPDLGEVASSVGMTVDEVVRAHAGATYRAAFAGFRPGFAYLVGLDPRLVVPRRSTPRTSVPRGSVAVADAYTGVYPAASPGGWNLLGTTDVSLWDLDRDPPAVLVPGTVVRFIST